MDAQETMENVAGQVREEFEEANRILSFSDWLDLFLASPYRLGRSAIQYVADMFDHYGTVEIPAASGTVPRLLLFDQEFKDGMGRVHGQEEVQREIYRVIRTTADEGRADRLVLMHGPNGSGKSVIVEAIFRGLEDYSSLPEGALYRFNWVFPKTSGFSEALGFRGAGPGAAEPASYATMDGEELDARLVCELRDHPIFLFPREHRHRVLEQALERNPEDRRHSFRYLLEGELCQKCKGIYEGLLAGHRGDWEKVIRHVQVERLFLSQRFREGAVTIQPMSSPDAREQQITADISLQNLPPVLQNLKIFEPFGDLVDGNGGVVEFGDFLKRPMELNTYLLNAVEKGTITLPNTLVYLNLVMMGTSNEKHLDAFKTTPEWTSFKGRIELVAVPYILEYEREAAVYRDLLTAVRRQVHIAPHTFRMAALWAVLTRLLRPDPERLPAPLGDLVASLTPLEKAWLYQHHTAPDRMDRENRQRLVGGLALIREHHRENIVYEGRFGASAREMRMVLTRAAHDRRSPCLSPPGVFDSIRELTKEKTVYDFLKLKPSGGYHDAEGFVDQVSSVYARIVLEEFQDAMALIREEEYDRRFDLYIQHVIAFNRKENVLNPQTGRLEPPSEDQMQAVEQMFDFDEPREIFRKDLVARIGAYSLDHPAERLDFRHLFPDLLRSVKRKFFEERREKVGTLLSDLLRRGTGEWNGLPRANRELVETTLGNLTRDKGYCEGCVKEIAAFLQQQPLTKVVTSR